jgi:hypothetical protein
MQTLTASRMNTAALNSRAVRRTCARNAERIRSQLLGEPRRPVRVLAQQNATDIVSEITSATTQLAGAHQAHAASQKLHLV